MNPLELIGALTIFAVVAFFFIILVISPILDTIEAYKYNKELYKLQTVKREIEYWYDKLYMITGERMTVERQLNDRQALENIYDEYKRNNEIIREEISKKIGWVLNTDTPGEMNERYYNAHRKISDIKKKLGMIY